MHEVNRRKQKQPNIKLRQAREQHCWTLEELAFKINDLPDYGPGQPDAQTIGRWERGVTSPSPRYRRALCEIFQLSLQELGLMPEEAPMAMVTKSKSQVLEREGPPPPVISTSSPLPEHELVVSTLPDPPDLQKASTHSLLFSSLPPMPDIEIMHGEPRPFRRSSSHWWLIALTILVVVVLVGGGWLYWRIRATSIPEMYAKVMHTHALYMDPLIQQDFYKWDVEELSDGSCYFANGSYHIHSAQKETMHFCLSQVLSLCDIGMQVEMTILQGDGGGLVIRSRDGLMYRMRFSSDGSYDLVDQTNRPLTRGFSPVFHKGLGEKNVLYLIALGPQLAIYVNGQYSFSVNDSVSQCGRVGFLSVSFFQATDVIYNNVKIWDLTRIQP